MFYLENRKTLPLRHTLGKRMPIRAVLTGMDDSQTFSRCTDEVSKINCKTQQLKHFRIIVSIDNNNFNICAKIMRVKRLLKLISQLILTFEQLIKSQPPKKSFTWVENNKLSKVP